MKAEALQQCQDFMQNDTVIDCPVESDKNSNEFLVVVHNQESQDREHLLRILVPGSNYQTFLWDGHKEEFREVDADILEQKHYDKKNGSFSDSMIFIKTNISSDSVALVKLVKSDKSHEAQLAQEEINKTLTQEKSLTL